MKNIAARIEELEKEIAKKDPLEKQKLFRKIYLALWEIEMCFELTPDETIELRRARFVEENGTEEQFVATQTHNTAMGGGS